ncbi:MAG: FAD-dependent 5-carboxymethylaminomethyl-2-thiouridine(34) oxidoreductase MnmC [Methylotenera sp.]
MKTAIVIGGGIAGCSTAYFLSQRGVPVTLVERHENLAQEASGNPIAVLYPKFSTKPDASTLLALQGFEFTLNLLKNLPNSTDFFNACGIIQLAFNAREQARQLALGDNQYAKLIDANAATKIAGIVLKTGGLYFPQAGWVKPQALCEKLCNHALITKMTSTSALTIKKSELGWQVNDVLLADIVVICNANDVQQFAQYRSAKITPMRGQVNFFAENAQSKNIKTIICSDHYLSPAVAGWHAIGTSYAPNDLNQNISESDTRENLNALRKMAPEIAEGLAIDTIKSRVAWRSQTLDYIPLAGRLINEEILRNNPPRFNVNPADLPWYDGLYVNAGHGSKGMITAPICGELIASLATNSDLPIEPKLASKLNPSRFLLREFGAKLLANSLYK